MAGQGWRSWWAGALTKFHIHLALGCQLDMALLYVPEYMAKVASEKAMSMNSSWHITLIQPGFPKGKSTCPVKLTGPSRQ